MPTSFGFGIDRSRELTGNHSKAAKPAMHMSKEKKYSAVPETMPFQMLFTRPWI
jgi:hypothetical protein